MTSTKTRSDLTSVNFYRNHISPSIHPDLPILYTSFLTISSSIIAIIGGFDLSIHKRLEEILTLECSIISIIVRAVPKEKTSWNVTPKDST